MKNLKRILSLALASVMVVGMMVVGASAATFADQDEISDNHVTAVEIVKALGVMNGKPEGFDPQGTFTRAEMATVIATIHNKGVAPNFAKKQNPTYSDVPNSHWAASYIEYCTNFGLVGGVGGGKFDPEAPASATQTARMLLNLMGYTVPAGADWALTTETQARSNANLYATLVDEIADPGKSIKREQVAQMVNNALNAAMVDEKGNAITTDGGWKLENANSTTAWGGSASLEGLASETYETYLEAYTSANTTGKTLGTDYNIVKQPARTTKLGGVYLGMSTQNIGVVTKIEPDSEGKGYRINASPTTTGILVPEDPSELMGLEAEVISKGGKNYGITAVGTVVFEGTVGDITVIASEHTANKTIHLGDETFKTASATLSDTKIHNWNAWSTQEALSTSISLNKEYAIKAISNNSKGEIDHIVAMPVAIKEIAYISATNINVSGGYSGSIKDSEGKVLITGTEGLKKGDKVLYTAAANTADNVAVLEKVDTIEGQVDGVRANGSVLVNGTWYPKATASVANVTPGSEGTLTMVNGYYVGFTGKAGAAASTDIFFVVKVAAKTNGLDAATWQARVITKEGKYQDIDLGFASSVTDTAAAAKALVGGWHTYTEKDGVYTLTAAKATAAAAGYDKAYINVNYDYTAANNGTPASKVLKGKVAADDQAETTLRLADDAVVIVNYNGSSTNDDAGAAVVADPGTAIDELKTLKVITGKDLKAMTGDIGVANGRNTLNVAYAEMVNGIEYVKFVFLANKMKSLPDAAGTDGFGYVVSDSYSIKEGSNTYTTFEVWDGEDVITVKAKDNADAATKGAFITYTDLGNGIIEAVVDAGLTKGAVVGSNDALVSILQGNTNSTKDDDTVLLTTDDDTLFFYVDSSKVEGKTGGAIQNATEDTRESTYVNRLFANVKYAAANGVATIIVVDVNNSFVDPTDGVTLEFVQGGKQAAVTVAAATAAAASDGAAVVTAGAVTGANTGATTTYQWQKSTDTTDGSDGTWTNISGATRNTYSATANGWYRVVVTVTFQPNQIGAEQQQTATSAGAQVSDIT